VFASLERALAIYGSGKNGETPVRDKSALVDELRKAMAAASKFCGDRDVDLAAIQKLPRQTMERLEQLGLAVEALIAPDGLRQEFFGHTRLVTTLFRAIMPDVAAVEFAGPVACINAIADSIRGKLNDKPADISMVMEGISEVLDYSIAGVSIPETPGTLLELSKIDFDALAKKFKQSQTKKTDVEMLKAAIRAKLTEMITVNKTRADYAEKFEELIELYNNGSRTIEDLFHELTVLTASLNVEQQRHVRENMSEEELVIFDLLMKPAPELTDKERTEVKGVARDLLVRLKDLLVINWRQKASAKSQVRLAIEDVLDGGLPRAFTKTLYESKCETLFQHVYERYPDYSARPYVT